MSAARFWTRIFTVNFLLGVAGGKVMAGMESGPKNVYQGSLFSVTRFLYFTLSTIDSAFNVTLQNAHRSAGMLMTMPIIASVGIPLANQFLS